MKYVLLFPRYFFYVFTISIIIISCIEISLFATCTSTIFNNIALPESDELIKFDFKDTKITALIDLLASKIGCNFIVPQGAQSIQTKLSIAFEKPLTLQEAWDLLLMTLDMAGYTITMKKNLFIVEKISKDIVKTPMPIYIGVDSTLLPNNDQFIKYLYFLSNAQVGEEAESEIKAILTGFLPENASIKLNSESNSFLLCAPSNAIKKAMIVINELDSANYQEIVKPIYLRYAHADNIANLLKNIAAPANADQNKFRPDARKSEAINALSRSLKIIPDSKSNRIILVGRPHSVEQISNIIMNEFDVPIDPSGKSVLHTRTIQYLDAVLTAQAIEKVVRAAPATPQGQQSRGDSGPGLQRYLDNNIVIKTDKPEASTITSPDQGPSVFQGNNKLLVAARNDDWHHINGVIDELDQSPPLVYFEIVLADLTIDDTRKLGSIIRNPAKLPFAQVAMQAAHLAPGIITDSWANPQTIGHIDSPKEISADLLRTGFTATGGRDDSGTISAASFQEPGSTVVSLNDNDNQTWGILQTIKIIDINKVISHPHIIATHNKPAKILIGESRYVTGDTRDQQFTNVVINRIPINANLNVTILPRISDENTVNLQISITVNDFRGANNQRVTREVTTNVNLHNGDIVALGGFIRENNKTDLSETPFLSKIPIFGWLGKSRNNALEKTHLTAFISPTIIMPPKKAMTRKNTADYVNIINKHMNKENVLGSLRDPITRFIFPNSNTAMDNLKRFVTHDPTLAVNLEGNLKMENDLLLIQRSIPGETTSGISDEKNTNPPALFAESIIPTT